MAVPLRMQAPGGSFQWKHTRLAGCWTGVKYGAETLDNGIYPGFPEYKIGLSFLVRQKKMEHWELRRGTPLIVHHQ